MTDSSYTFIIWPERRFIPEHEMWVMYEDACKEGHIVREHMFAHDIQTVRQALTYAGVIVMGESY